MYCIYIHDIVIKILHLTSSQSNSENMILVILNTLGTQPFKNRIKMACILQYRNIWYALYLVNIVVKDIHQKH